VLPCTGPLGGALPERLPLDDLPELKQGRGILLELLYGSAEVTQKLLCIDLAHAICKSLSRQVFAPTEYPVIVGHNPPRTRQIPMKSGLIYWEDLYTAASRVFPGIHCVALQNFQISLRESNPLLITGNAGGRKSTLLRNVAIA